MPRPASATTWVFFGLGLLDQRLAGNVGYFVLLFSTLGYFVPVFGEGNTPIICASVLLWTVHFLVMRGIKEAAFINK